MRSASWLPVLVLVGWASSMAWHGSGQASAAASHRFAFSPADTRQRMPRDHASSDDRREKKRGVSIATPAGTTYYAITYFSLHTQELLPVATHAVHSFVKPSRVRVQSLQDGVNEGLNRMAWPQAERVNEFLRCRATGRVTHISPAVIRVSARAARHFHRRRVDVVSAYRSVKFNELLRKKGHNVASRSLHMRGQALDFALKDVEAEELAPFVARIHKGGIGTYVENDFVHVDVGPDRRWRGK